MPQIPIGMMKDRSRFGKLQKFYIALDWQIPCATNTASDQTFETNFQLTPTPKPVALLLTWIYSNPNIDR